MGSSGKEQMPKISGEFKPAPQPPAPSPKDARAQVRPPQPVTRAPQPVARAPQAAMRPPQAAARSPQPVTKPAPMAPRNPGKPVPQPSGARPVSPIPQGAPGLGDRLRAERQAAEKLADQRVAQARGKSGDRPLQPPVNVTGNQNQRSAPKPPERPKFSFSPEELAKDKREQVPPEREFPAFSPKSSTATPPPPPLTPPRPALGGTPAAQAQQPRQPIQAPPLRQPPPKPAAANPPAGAGFQPRFNGPAQPSGGNYRSLDPPPGGAFPPKPKPYADTAFRDDPLAHRPGNREYDSYRRGLPQAPQPAYGDDGGPSLGDYRRRQQVPARTRQPAFDDVNEVFEDEEPQRPQRRRASAQDYNRAYRDYEEGYDTDAPRRRGPWPWLLAILLGGVLITGGMIYYYLNYYKQSGPAAGNVPVIEAPEQGAKTAPEPSSGSTLGIQGAAQPDATDKTKQIYDRILGDDEAGGNQVVPTQEQPQVVEPTGSNEGQNTAPVPDQPSGLGDNADEPLPLPLPPPGEQGALPSNASQQTAALGTTTTKVNQSAPESASTTTTDSGAPVPGQLSKATEQADTPLPQIDTSPPQIEQVVSTPEPLPEKPAKPKARAEKKPVKKVAAVEAVDDVGAGQNSGVEPLVLVPPAQSGNAEAQTPPTPIVQPDVGQAANPETVQPAEEKSKSFFGFGSTKRKLTGKAAEQAQAQGAAGNWANSPDPNATVSDPGAAPAPLPEQQVASVAPEPIPLPAPEPAPQPAKPVAGGFVAQLASFRSEAEAMAEFDRLRAKHGSVLGGLSPRVVKATIGGSPRYRLGVGPLASRSAALKICNSLISAGERDCLVRGN